MSGKWIVIFKDEVTSDQITKYVEDVKAAGGELKARFDLEGGILNGFAATIPHAFLESFKCLKGGEIAYIEPDSEVKIQT